MEIREQQQREEILSCNPNHRLRQKLRQGKNRLEFRKL
jgi:hypothetical protein